MPENSESPMMGRLVRAEFGFLSSTCGFPVAGSIGSFSQTTTPQIPPPHLPTRTFASPAWVSQMPSGPPPAFAGAAANNAAKVAIVMPNLQAIELSSGNAACITTNHPGAMPYLLPQRYFVVLLRFQARLWINAPRYRRRSMMVKYQYYDGSTDAIRPVQGSPWNGFQPRST